MKVLVINQYAGNKGDRAVCHFVERELKRYGVDTVTVSTHDRRFWTGTHNTLGIGTHFVPWGWNVEKPLVETRFTRRVLWEKRRVTRRILFPWIRTLFLSGRRSGWLWFSANHEFLMALRGADLVIGTGGHHITTRFSPDAVVEMVYDMMIALILRKPLVLWSQTIGPLMFDNPRSELAVRRILNEVNSIFVRDDSSLEELRKFDVNRPGIRRTFESVIGLADEVNEYVSVSNRAPLVGVTVYNAEKRTRDEEERYCSTMAWISDFLVGEGMRIRFFPHEMKGAVVDDRACIQRIMQKMRAVSGAEVADEDLSSISHLREISKCRFFIGHKTHSVIFALTAGTPLIAIAYHPKTSDFMSQYGLSRNCIQEADLSPKAFTKVFRQLERELDLVGVVQFQTSQKHGSRVREDFAEMLSTARVSF